MKLGRSLFLLTVVYKIPNNTQKQILWHELEGLANSISTPWVTIDNFNDITSLSKQTRGSGGSNTKIRIFTNRIKRHSLTNLCYNGPRFIWKGPCLVGGHRLHERLDQAMANDAFMTEFASCSIQVMPQIQFSDHNPIYLNYVANEFRFGNRPFRFEVMWLKHCNYKEFLDAIWVDEGDINQSLSNL